MPQVCTLRSVLHELQVTVPLVNMTMPRDVAFAEATQKQPASYLLKRPADGCRSSDLDDVSRKIGSILRSTLKASCGVREPTDAATLPRNHEVCTQSHNEICVVALYDSVSLRQW